ncbi:hypothetical protein LTR66_001010 [Elasticomyces elasticus]|nr:hypothetical protein LTR66_001010 [Elasticomyces elasticus]
MARVTRTQPLRQSRLRKSMIADDEDMEDTIAVAPKTTPPASVPTAAPGQKKIKLKLFVKPKSSSPESNDGTLSTPFDSSDNMAAQDQPPAKRLCHRPRNDNTTATDASDDSMSPLPNDVDIDSLTLLSIASSSSPAPVPVSAARSRFEEDFMSSYIQDDPLPPARKPDAPEDVIKTFEAATQALVDLDPENRVNALKRSASSTVDFSEKDFKEPDIDVFLSVADGVVPITRKRKLMSKSKTPESTQILGETDEDMLAVLKFAMERLYAPNAVQKVAASTNISLKRSNHKTMAPPHTLEIRAAEALQKCIDCTGITVSFSNKKKGKLAVLSAAQSKATGALYKALSSYLAPKQRVNPPVLSHIPYRINPETNNPELLDLPRVRPPPIINPPYNPFNNAAMQMPMQVQIQMQMQIPRPVQNGHQFGGSPPPTLPYPPPRNAHLAPPSFVVEDRFSGPNGRHQTYVSPYAGNTMPPGNGNFRGFVPSQQQIGLAQQPPQQRAAQRPVQAHFLAPMVGQFVPGRAGPAQPNHNSGYSALDESGVFKRVNEMKRGGEKSPSGRAGGRK